MGKCNVRHDWCVFNDDEASSKHYHILAHVQQTYMLQQQCKFKIGAVSLPISNPIISIGLFVFKDQLLNTK